VAATAFEPLEGPAVELAPDPQPRPDAELHVRPVEPERFRDPDPGLGEQLVERAPALRQPRQEPRQLGARERLRLGPSSASSRRPGLWHCPETRYLRVCALLRSSIVGTHGQRHL
jgi:hypothetical protein